MISDLERKLKAIEAEQQQQDNELSDIERDFEEIRRLEQRLANINDENIEARASELAGAVMFDSEADARKLEKELKHINEQFKPQQTPTTVAVNEGVSIADDLLFEDDETKETTNKHGFVIRLLFNQDSPTEWSEEGGGGWRDRGSGHCYVSMEKAQARCQELQVRWPDYPLDIIKR